MTALVFLHLTAALLPAFERLYPENYRYFSRAGWSASTYVYNMLVYGRMHEDGELEIEHINDTSKPGRIVGQSIFILGVSKFRKGPSSNQCYEFRSGILIPGTMDFNGQFTPEIGGKIIPFSEYRYTPLERPIWNLPGYFSYIGPGPRK